MRLEYVFIVFGIHGVCALPSIAPLACCREDSDSDIGLFGSPCQCWKTNVSDCEELKLIIDKCCMHGGTSPKGCWTSNKNWQRCCGTSLGTRWSGHRFRLDASTVLKLAQKPVPRSAVDRDGYLANPTSADANAPHFFAQILQAIGARSAAEVGVFRGEFGAHLLQLLPGVEDYYAVDPWKRQDSSNDPWHYVDQHENLMIAAKSLYAAGGSRVHIVQLASLNASGAFDVASLDFVMLDARHDYCSVSDDLRAWWPKIKPGGVIAGDDFHRAEGSGIAESWQLCPNGERHLGGVAQAVDDFFDEEFGGAGSQHVLFFPPHFHRGMRANPHWFVQKPSL